LADVGGTLPAILWYQFYFRLLFYHPDFGLDDGGGGMRLRKKEVE